jgi:hypothetical protein
VVLAFLCRPERLEALLARLAVVRYSTATVSRCLHRPMLSSLTATALATESVRSILAVGVVGAYLLVVVVVVFAASELLASVVLGGVGGILGIGVGTAVAASALR